MLYICAALLECCGGLGRSWLTLSCRSRTPTSPSPSPRRTDGPVVRRRSPWPRILPRLSLPLARKRERERECAKSATPFSRGVADTFRETRVSRTPGIFRSQFRKHSTRAARFIGASSFGQRVRFASMSPVPEMTKDLSTLSSLAGLRSPTWEFIIQPFLIIPINVIGNQPTSSDLAPNHRSTFDLNRKGGKFRHEF